MRPKHPSELTTLTDLVLPSETNPLNNLLANWQRIVRLVLPPQSISQNCYSICQSRGFNRAIPVAVVTVEAKVSGSMESTLLEDREDWK
jgi:hypothetical protein